MRVGWLLLGFVLALVLVLAPGRWASSVHAADKPAQKHDAPKDGKGEGGGMDLFKGFTETAVWSIIVFLVVLYILSKTAWKWILEGMTAREHRINSAIDEAKQIKGENDKLRADMEAERRRMAEQIRETLDEIRRAAQHLQDGTVAAGQAKIAEERQRMLTEVARMHEEALSDTFNKTTQLATLISAKAIGRSLSVEDHQRLFDEALADLRVNLNGQKT